MERHAEENDAQCLPFFGCDASRVHQLIDILEALLDGFIDARIIRVAGDSVDGRDQTLKVVGADHRGFPRP